MTYAELVLRCVSALKHKGTHGISYWPGGIIAVAWFKSYVCFNLGAQIAKGLFRAQLALAAVVKLQ